MDMRPADLPLLLSLQKLLETGNVTKAAEQLSISQPALSAQLSRMRDLFGDPVLVPSGAGKGMVPTPWAESVRGPLRDALQALDAVIRVGGKFDPRTSPRHFRILANDNAAALVAPMLARGLGEGRWPELQFSITAPPTDKKLLAEQLEDGSADILLSSEAGLPESAQRVCLVQNAFVMAQRPRHPRGRHAPTAREYSGLAHMVVSSRGEFDSFVDEALTKLGLKRKVQMSVQYYTLAPLLVEASNMVCTLPTAFLSSYGRRLDIFPLDFLPRKFGLFAGWHPRFDHDLAHSWLRQQIVEACKQRTA